MSGGGPAGAAPGFQPAGTESRRAGMQSPEARRLAEDARRTKNWKRWGPYLAERQWGTVREDYSPYGTPWVYFPHEMARSRAYRWGEDGLLGICDRECRLCFALALWNGKDPILKERLFGVTGWEGNHGEDAKECWFYLDSTPTHSYLKGLYKYPQAEYPYERLRAEASRRSRADPELELEDTGVFDGDRYFDVFVEYAKAAPDDIGIRITIANRGPEAAALDVLPTLWFRNTWSWGRTGESYWPKPRIALAPGERGVELEATHATLGAFRLAAEPHAGADPQPLFTENETNAERLYGAKNASPYTKDAFHEAIVNGRQNAVNPAQEGTRAALRYRIEVPARGEVVLRLRLFSGDAPPQSRFGDDFARTFASRIREADELHAALEPAGATPDERRIMRQGRAGLLWTKQFYHFVAHEWLEGDPAYPPPDPGRGAVRNGDWPNLYNRDVISMPDKWEYPWYAAWDLAFHMVPFARIDATFAKEQLLLLLREWYMHPNGQIPAYEWNFSDTNPPVHAWACWRVYKLTGPRGGRDRLFLSRAFKKLLVNFTWWVNRKDPTGHHIFSGGFLGLDNVGVFDRSKPLPSGGTLAQADGTAWMAFYCATMLAIALELAAADPSYEDIASKFFEHFVSIADAMNTLGGSGLWDEVDGFYYDQLHVDGHTVPLRIRSMVGLVPLFAVEILDQEAIDRLPGFQKRLRWFLENRRDLARHISYLEHDRADGGADGHRLLAIPSRERLERVLRRLLDEREFLSPFGIRSLSRAHAEHPFVFRGEGGDEHRIHYAPGESDTGLFGGNSNWRGPIWFPVNYLLIEALERYGRFYQDTLKVECPVGSGRFLTLGEVAAELNERLVRIFLADPRGRRPCNGDSARFADDPHWRDLVLFHEYFHADTGQGLGANHQTGWTALVVRCLYDRALRRAALKESGPATTL